MTNLDWIGFILDAKLSNLSTKFMSKNGKPQRCTRTKAQAQQHTSCARVQVEVMLHQEDSLESSHWQANITMTNIRDKYHVNVRCSK